MIEINDLPDEVIEFILSHIPPYKDLEECQLVCKRWKSLVKNVMRHTKINLNKGLLDFRLCWKSINALETNSTIAGRFGHSAVVHESSMYVFGGNSSTDTTFNDLWRFDLSKRQWIRLLSMGSYPSPKAAASIVCHGDQLVLFGGWRKMSVRPVHQPWILFDELHLYNIKTNHWTLHTSISGPPPMAGHSATIHLNKMIIFGGYQYDEEVYSNSNDVWCLDLNTFTWLKPEIGNIKPPPRYGQFQTALDDNNLLIVGGCGGPNNMFSDAWVLNTSGNVWQWRNITIKNKKWAATHMWCNPACRVGTKLVILGPTPSLPTDFQTLKQQMPQSVNRLRRELPREENHIWNLNPRQVYDNLRNLQVQANPQRVISYNNTNNNNNNNNNNSNNNNNASTNRNNDNQAKKANEDETASRLQKNLALRCRDDHPKLPKRFDEPYEGRIKLAAFNVHEDKQNGSRQRQQERVRRMEEKMLALQNLRRVVVEQKPEEPSPKRAKRNCLAIFVCDISNILATEPFMEWIEYKNFGIISGAPERLIFSSIVPGNGELVMFGGVHKESLSDITYQVSNSLYFLTAPTPII